ncbi:MAG TPA: methyltransferase domain-containing protein [Gemmatimonadales bacterium]|nr:methyltransferase domain-containing protein [Gemmatimonadales bacterium]
MLFAGTLAAQEGETGRERWQRVPDVFAALGVGPGVHVADIGAGGGFFTARLAQAVGNDGRVFAVDIDAGVIGRLRERAEREQWSNVEIIHSRPDDPRLPHGALDAALIVNTYHEFTAVEAMLRGLARALKPGGRLVIVDQVPPPSRIRDERTAQERAHELGSWFAVRDLVGAGFRIVCLEDPFIVAAGTDARDDWWLLAAVRGAEPGR